MKRKPSEFYTASIIAVVCWATAFSIVAEATVLASGTRLTDADVAGIRRATDGYAEGWRRNHREAVLMWFHPNALIVPSGGQPIRGLEAIANFWWPTNGGRTTITHFSYTTDEIGGSRDCAFVRGTFAFDFEYEQDGKTTNLSNAGNYLMLLARDDAGNWKITHRMWADRRR